MRDKNSKTLWAIALSAFVTIILSATITYVLLELKFKEPISITVSDWIKVVLPIVGSGILVIFAFLGVDRLKNYDERQDRLSKELHDEINTKISDASIKFVPEFEKIIAEKSETFATHLDTYEKRLLTLDEQTKRYDEILGSVDNIKTISDSIGNIEEARTYIIKHTFSETSENPNLWQERTRTLRVLINRIKNCVITGDSDDYHNIAVDLARRGYRDYACEVILTGLKYYPFNIDLLSDSLEYVHTFENADNIAANSINTLEEMGRNSWNWRAFTFYIDYINDKSPSPENKKLVSSLIADYKSILANDERAYMAEYKTMLKYGEVKKAKDALEYAEKNIEMTAQCSLALSELYRQNGEYDAAIQSAEKAIQSQAETQPSSDTGAAFAFRAFARDAKILSEFTNKNTIDTKDILDTLSDYKMALEFGYSHQNLINRIIILEKLLPSEVYEEIELRALKERVDELEKIIVAFLRSSSNDDN